jgi:hypothetical protein
MNDHVHFNQLIEHIPAALIERIGKSDAMICCNPTTKGCTHTRVDKISATTFRVRHGKYRALRRAEPQLP